VKIIYITSIIAVCICGQLFSKAKKIFEKFCKISIYVKSYK